MSGTPSEPRRRWVSAASWWGNTLFMQGIIVFLTFARFDDGRFSFDWWPVAPWGAAMLAAVLLAVLARTRMPWVFLAVAALPNLFYAFGMHPPYSMLGLLLSLAFAVYAVASTVPLWAGAAVVGSIWLLFIVVAVLNREMTIVHLFPGSLTAGLTVALAVGQAAYARRRMFEATERRAAEAERTREALTTAKVAEQRLATARDLHDIVGHEIAVINLQAGVAHESVRKAPDDALASLVIIQRSAQTILGEIAELLRELRTSTPGLATPDRGVAALPGLARTLSAAGAPVDLQIAHNLPDLPSDVDNAIYRIVEESLVNAYKHGTPGGIAEVRVGCTADELSIDASNPVATVREPSASGGLGIIGIKERARALGGSAKVSLDAGTYRMSVRLPVGRK